MDKKRPVQEHERENATALVTVQTFRTLPEAMLAKAMLESAGIDCFLADDNAARILGSDISDIRVQVDSIDADAAIALLQASG